MSFCPAEYWIWLQTALGAGARTDELLSYFGDPEKLYNAGSREWKLSGLMTEKRIEALKSTSLSQTGEILGECRKKGYTIITPDSPLFPERLKNLSDMPLVLYGAGDCSVLKDTVSIGIVGTRNASTYGMETAQRLSFSLAKAGVTIVSGGALGIDSEAHAGAMLASGRTAAVLGCGLSFDYLKENAPLRRAIMRHGAVITEYQPFTAASRSTFPIRNRLISGITLGTVVIEAGIKSGSLITAGCALEQGRDVFAIPGDIVRSSFDGTNHLIKQGAKPVFSAEDILSEYEFLYGDLINFEFTEPLSSIKYVDFRNYKKKAEESGKNGRNTAASDKNRFSENTAKTEPQAKRKELSEDISEEAKTVYSVIESNGTHIDDIVRKSGLKMNTVLSSLTELELSGFVEQMNGKKYIIL